MTTDFHLRTHWQEPSFKMLPKRPLKVRAGRSEVFLLDHPKGTLVARPYRHGGLRRLVLPAHFLKSDRPAQELAFHQRAFDGGIATVEPVGWSERRTALPMFRYYTYFTAFVDGAATLPQYLKQEGAHRGLLNQMAQILHQLFQNGIFHHDLNLNNWLVVNSRVLLIDFDKARDVDWDASRFLIAVGARIARSGKKLGLLTYKRAFLRLIILASRRFGIRARPVLEALPETLMQVRLKDKIRWMLSGGHQNSA